MSPDTKVLYSSLSALSQQYPEGDALRYLVIDDLTGLPVQFENLDLGGDELALVEAIAAGAPGVADVSDGHGDSGDSGASDVADVSAGHGTVVRAPVVSPDPGARAGGRGDGNALPSSVPAAAGGDAHAPLGRPALRVFRKFVPNLHALSDHEKAQVKAFARSQALSWKQVNRVHANHTKHPD